MYIEDARVNAPNPETPIWRYIDFPKFVDMLERRALHFSSMNALGDPFEGMPSEATIEERREQSRKSREQAIAAGIVDPNFQWPPDDPWTYYRVFRVMTYVSCWHVNEFESMAMWRLYSRDGIAIKSTFQRLTDSLKDVPEQVFAGQVVYRDRRDRSNVEFPGDAITVGFRKGMSYDHEREIRASFLRDTRPLGQQDSTLEEYERIQENGLNIGPIDLDVLVDTVYVAPGRPPWFRELVGRVMRTYRLDKPLENSGLDDRPDLT
jgi:hypothetical protein